MLCEQTCSHPRAPNLERAIEAGLCTHPLGPSFHPATNAAAGSSFRKRPEGQCVSRFVGSLAIHGAEAEVRRRPLSCPRGCREEEEGLEWQANYRSKGPEGHGATRVPLLVEAGRRDRTCRQQIDQGAR